jgi:hypothetical protein
VVNHRLGGLYTLGGTAVAGGLALLATNLRGLGIGLAIGGLLVLVATLSLRPQATIDVDHRQNLRNTATRLIGCLREHEAVDYGDAMMKDSFRAHYKKVAKQLDSWDELVELTVQRRLSVTLQFRQRLGEQGISVVMYPFPNFTEVLVIAARERIAGGITHFPFMFNWLVNGGVLEMGNEGAVGLAAITDAGLTVESYERAIEDTFAELQTWPQAVEIGGEFLDFMQASRPIISELEILQTAASYPHALHCRLC